MLKKIILFTTVIFVTILPNEALLCQSVNEQQDENTSVKRVDQFNKLMSTMQETQRLLGRQFTLNTIYGACIALALFFLTGQVCLLANKPISVVHFHQLPEDYLSSWNKYN